MFTIISYLSTYPYKSMILPYEISHYTPLPSQQINRTRAKFIATTSYVYNIRDKGSLNVEFYLANVFSSYKKCISIKV